MPLINPMFWSLMLTHDSLTRAFTPLYSCSEISLSHLSLHISRVNWNVILWCLHFHPSFWINWLFKMSFYACRLSGFSCVQLFNSMDYSPSGFSVNEFLQARILECHALLQGSFCSSLYLSFSLKVPQRYKSLLVLTMPKPLTVWITINWGKFWKRWEYKSTWPASWEICMQVKRQQLETDMDWFPIGKGVCQGCILSPCLFNLYAEYIMRNVGWMKHKLESKLLEEISIISDMQMTPPLWQKVKKN